MKPKIPVYRFTSQQDENFYPTPKAMIETKMEEARIGMSLMTLSDFNKGASAPPDPP